MEQTVTRLRTDSLDDIPIGIIRLCTDQRVCYANRAAREMTDGKVKTDASIFELPVDSASRQKLAEQLALRFNEGASSSYDVNLIDATQAITDVLNITAVPEYDDNNQLIGSIGFIRSRRLETAALSMHKVIGEAHHWHSLLEGVGAQLHKYIKFDTMLVTVVSRNRKHLRSLIETDPQASRQGESDFRSGKQFKWWPMPEFVKLMLQDIRPEFISVREMLADPLFVELAERDPAMQSWLKEKYLYLLRYPVYEGTTPIAVVSLQRREDEPFSSAEVSLFQQLPIQEAVKIALILDQKSEADFSLDLLKDLGEVAEHIGELQSRLVTRLAAYYGWEHVSLFSVDRDKKVFRLAAQHSVGARCLKHDYHQSFNEGVLGEVLSKGAAVVVQDVSERKKLSTYVEGLKDSKSDMCLPVPGGRLRWILNVESTKRDAFADEEQQSVELLLKMVGFMLDRAATMELKSAIFASVADAVVLTTRDGAIHELNPAARRMLGVKHGDLRERNLKDYLHPGPAHSGLPVEMQGFSTTLVESKHVGSTPVTLVGEDGRETPALASGALLPTDLGGKVFVFSDLTYATRLHELENLKSVFGLVAGETRVPVALASAFVSDLAKAAQALDPDGRLHLSELANKALAQLRKADLPMERLVRLAAQRPDQQTRLAVLNVRETVEQLLAELPRHEADAIGIEPSPGDAFVKTGVSEFGFCFQSIVAYLLRRKSQNEQLQVTIDSEKDRTVVAIQLKETLGGATRVTSMIQELTDLKQFAFPQDFIKEMMQRMGCGYSPPSLGDPRFVMDLPSV
jgi:PAS domain S-box-containing protein